MGKVNRTEESVVVCFGRFETHARLEQCLLRKYAFTLSKDVCSVTFDLSDVEEIDFFALNLILLWMINVKRNGTAIVVRLPAQMIKDSDGAKAMERLRRRIDALSLLHDTRFIAGLIQFEIVSSSILLGYQRTRSDRKAESIVAPITSLKDANDLDGFLAEYMPHVQGRLSFADSLDLSVVRSGEIRDVVLRELGDNIFEHASGSVGFVSLSHTSTLAGGDTAKEDVLGMRVDGRLRPEQQFFRTLGSTGFLTIVVTDLGPGLENTLRSFADPALAFQSVRPNSFTPALINYSFLRDSTSKTPAERRAMFQRVIEEFSVLTLPATGLHWVREVAKDFRALLSMRTDGHFVSYDYLNYEQNGHPPGGLLAHTSGNRSKPLAQIGGLQLRITFPIQAPRKKQSTLFLASLPMRPKQREYSAITVTPPNISAPEDEPDQLAEWLFTTLDKLRVVSRDENRPHTLFLDLSGWSPSSSQHSIKAFYLLMTEAMRRQARDFAIVVVGAKNGLDRIADRLTALTLSEQTIPKERAFLGIDLQGEDLNVYGLLPDERVQLFSLMELENGWTALPSLPSALIKKLEAIVEEAPASGAIQLIDSYRSLREAYRDALGNHIAIEIKDPKGPVFNPIGCYLTPSRAYAEGYFNVAPLLKNVHSLNRLTTWISLQLDQHRPSTVIVMGRLMDRLSQELVLYRPLIHNVYVADPRDELDQVKVQLLPKGQNVAIVVDVIGTQNSIELLFESCRHFSVVRVYTFIDARYGTPLESLSIDGRLVPLTAIVKHPIRFWFEDIPPRYSYEEINVIDPKTNAPIPNTLRDEDPVWRSTPVCSGPSGERSGPFEDGASLLIGHYQNRSKHILYLFDTRRIAEQHGVELITSIKADLEKYVGRDLRVRDLKSIQVCYPLFTPGAGEIAKQLSVALDRCPIRGISEDDLCGGSASSDSVESAKIVVVFDDASSSGRTARQLIDFAEGRGAHAIFMYILCNRSESQEGRFLRRLRHYGSASIHVRYLSILNIPTYSPEACPICKRMSSLIALGSTMMQFTELISAIEATIESIRPQPISLLFYKDIAESLTVGDTSERARAWQLRVLIEESFRSLPVRKVLADKIKSYSTNGVEVLAIIRVLALEEHHLLANASFKSTVFYPRLRVVLVEACRHLIRKHVDSGLFIDALVTTGSAFDGEFLYSEWSHIVALCSNPSALKPIVVRLLLDCCRREKLPQIQKCFRVLNQRYPCQLVSQGIEYVGVMMSTLPVEDGVRTLQECMNIITDHNELAGHLFALSLKGNRPGLSGAFTETDARHLNEAVSIIKGDLFPRLHRLAEWKLTRSLKEDIVSLIDVAAVTADNLQRHARLLRQEARSILDITVATDECNGPR